MSRRDWKLYIEDIVSSIEKIEEYNQNLDFHAFKENNLVIDAVVRNLEVIGEAAKNVPEEIKKKYSFIPWLQITGLRNKIIHAYFVVDLKIIWQIIQKDLPELKESIRKIIEEKRKNKGSVEK